MREFASVTAQVVAAWGGVLLLFAGLGASPEALALLKGHRQVLERRYREVTARLRPADVHQRPGTHRASCAQGRHVLTQGQDLRGEGRCGGTLPGRRVLGRA